MERFKTAKFFALVTAWLLLINLGGSNLLAAELQTGSAQLLRQQTTEVQVINYTNMPELIHDVCAGAIGNFYDFFGPALVSVEPFIKYSEFPNRRISVLGITLADHMMARINNESLNQYISADDTNEQYLRGVMEEINGYLRIHIYGVNSRGERRSYVVNVEMSAPLYRVLHTYISG